MAQRRIPQMKDVMTPFPHFIDVSESVTAAREVMLQHGVRHLPLKSGGELSGVVAARDLEVAAILAKSPGLSGEPSLRDLCDEKAYVVDLHARLDEVMAEMATRRVASVLVIRDGRLAGILTVSDVCRLYGQLLSELSPPEDEPA